MDTGRLGGSCNNPGETTVGAERGTGWLHLLTCFTCTRLYFCHQNANARRAGVLTAVSSVLPSDSGTDGADPTPLPNAWFL